MIQISNGKPSINVSIDLMIDIITIILIIKIISLMFVSIPKSYFVGLKEKG